jgi:hypothetical protein
MKVIYISILSFLCTGVLRAQKKNLEKYAEISAGPSLGFRVLGKFNVPTVYKGSRDQFADSLNKADRPGQSLNLAAQYMVKKSAFNAFSIGVSYTDLTFRRVVTNMTLGYEIHPDVGIIAGVIQAGLLQINYDFHYKNIEVPLLWHRSAEGYGNLRDFDLWYFAGLAPAYMYKDRIHIQTQGFTLNGTNSFEVKDKEITGNSFNVLAHLGFRAQYHMYKKLHGLVQPHFRIPVLPSSGGMQTFWLPQLSLDLGLVFVLEDKKS